jgi:anti-sigma regulatory factor (Ser/Thr protein kinase)
LAKNDVKGLGSLTKTQIELRILANPDYLSVVRAAVRQTASVFGFDEDTAESITLAIVEALTNVIRHSYGGPCDKPIFVMLNKICCAEENKSALEIVIRDFGKQVNTDTIKSRDLDDVKPGGVGVHIIHSVMDEVEFSHADNCGMQLRLVKNIT